MENGKSPHLVVLGWSMRICTSNKFLGEDSAGPGTTSLVFTNKHSYDHSCTSLCKDICFHFLGVNKHLGAKLLDHVRVMFYFLRNYQTIF